jgi:histidinol-phosphatase
MKMDNLQSFFPVLNELSVKAGAIIHRHYQACLDVEMKSDWTPVTRADREVEIFLREALEECYPEFSILGEEYGETVKPGAYRWIIDPIDGTKSFVLKTPLFGTMIALERDGVPVLGSIYFPIQGHHLIGSAETGTFLNGTRCYVSQTAELSQAVTLLTDPTVLIVGVERDRVVRLCRSVRLLRGLGDCHGYGLVARGLADIMIEPVALKYHDAAPLAPIMAGAGGVFMNMRGDCDLRSGQGIATNHLLREQILRALDRQETSSGGSNG